MFEPYAPTVRLHVVQRARSSTAVGWGGSGGGDQYVDCEGALIELSPNHKENDPNGKIRVLRSFLWCARMGGVGWMTM